MALRIYLMGRVAIESGAALLDQDAFPGRQGMLAFARLALNRGAAVSREELASVLWPDAPPRAWDAAMNAVVSKLRALLAQAGLDRSDVLPATLGCYQLNLPAGAWIDTEAAFDSLHESEGLLKSDRFREAWAAAQVAYHILRRPFLPGEITRWVAQTREQLSILFVRACECLAESYIRNGEPEIAAHVASQAVAAQAFRETSYQLLMRAHAAAGNRAEALRAYEACRRLIADELGVSPSPETQAVYLQVLRMK